MRKRNKTEVFYKIEPKPADLTPDQIQEAAKTILGNMEKATWHNLIFGTDPPASQTQADPNAAPTFSITNWKEMLANYQTERKKGEFKINGIILNFFDYEEVSEQNRQFIPAGFRAFLNVKRTVKQKTENPLPTDLIIFNLSKGKAIFIGGNRRQYAPFWEQFIDPINYKRKF